MRNDAERRPRSRLLRPALWPPGKLDHLIGWWEANYLTAAQIYLKDNPLLRSTSSRGSSVTGARRPI